MIYAIVDCYTDEPSGLGVPPYLGTYPRYLFGALKNLDKKNEIYYLTIDDIRYSIGGIRENPRSKKTNIKIYNKTKNADNAEQTLNNADEIIIVVGINTPGKYLSAVPGSLNEIANYLKQFRGRKILTGPAAAVGSRMEGGKTAEKYDVTMFDEISFNYLGINDYENLHTEKSGEILGQIPYPVVIELEAGKGCDMGKCSFCTEPLKNCVQYRNADHIISEARSLSEAGAQFFRIGKATCFYSYQNGDLNKIEMLLKGVADLKPKVFHIDNVNPNKVITETGKEITKLVVKYCTSGNIAAFGVESFDIDVVKANRLNTSPENAIRAISVINDYGSERGENGMPKFLPGINLILGLLGERKKSLEINYDYLKKTLDKGLMLRRINIRQVVPFEGTYLYENGGLKFLKKNKKHYWSWRKKLRRELDFEFLKRLLPEGIILKDVYMEVHDGNNTFGRQFGTYPIIVGVKQKLELKKFYNVRIVGWMLRSVIAEIVE